MSFTAKTNFV